jgi:hypothetical protein
MFVVVGGVLLYFFLAGTTIKVETQPHLAKHKMHNMHRKMQKPETKQTKG